MRGSRVVVRRQGSSQGLRDAVLPSSARVLAGCRWAHWWKNVCLAYRRGEGRCWRMDGMAWHRIDAFPPPATGAAVHAPWPIGPKLDVTF